MSSSTVVLKAGLDGAWVGTQDRVAKIPTIAPKGMLHARGAGDTLVGGLLHGIAQGTDPFNAARWGVACAGLKVGGPSIQGQPTSEEVEEVLPSVRVYDAQSSQPVDEHERFVPLNDVVWSRL